MSYNITGLSHKNGIENEIDCYNWLVSEADKGKVLFLSGIKEKNIIKRGGTKSKSDVDIVSDDGSLISISIKNLSSKGSTHDWINLPIDNLGYFENVKQINEEKQLIRKKPLDERLNYLKYFKNFRKEKLNDLFNLISSDSLLLENFVSSNLSFIKNQKIIINDRKDKSFKVYEGKNHAIFDYLNNSNFFFSLRNLSGVAQESRSLVSVEKTSGQVFNLNLRFRLLSNNGDRAALGLNENLENKNNDSFLVIKVQQDQVRKQIACLKQNNKLEEYKY